MDMEQKLKEWKQMIDESQEELDEGTYAGDYDVFCFMKEAYEFIKQLEAENKEKKEVLKDIRARIREIKYHHTMPKKSRHGNTTRICEDIESRIGQVLKDKK